MIPINVWIAGRSYRIRVEPSTEEAVRRAVKAADARIADMRRAYAGRDDQDFVAMTLLLYAVEAATAGGESADSQAVAAEVTRLTARIDAALRRGPEKNFPESVEPLAGTGGE